jgi:tetratricopeptide (TPR) repeat protein
MALRPLPVRAGPRRAGLGAAILLGVLGAVGGCGRSEMNEHLEKGRSLLASGRFEEAHLEGLWVLLRSPENEEALHLVAGSLLEQGRDAEAEAYFRTLAELDPATAAETAALYDEKARADYARSEESRAARRWQIALSFKADQELGPYAFFMADRAFHERRFSEAADLYARAMAEFPDSSATARALYPYGASLHQLGRWSEAMGALERFLEAFPRHPQRHEAIWLYQEILIHEAQDLKARMDIESAIVLLNRVLNYRDNPPKSAEALLELGDCYERIQDYASAIGCYRRIVKEYADGAGRLYGDAVTRLEKLEKARLR